MRSFEISKILRNSFGFFEKDLPLKKIPPRHLKLSIVIYLHRVPNYPEYPYFASIIVYRHHCFEVVGMFSMEQQSFKKN